MLVALILLLPFGALSYSRHLLAIEAFILLSLLFAVIPFPAAIDHFNAKTLIDEPFLSLLLFIPLSILLGLNFAGLEKFLGDGPVRQIPNVLPVLLVILFVFFPNRKVLAPSRDVNFVTANDLLLYDEIRNRMPTGIEILIPNASPYYDLGVDGGAWINFVTGRKTIRVNYETDLTSHRVFQKMCRMGARYIYLGSKPYSFSLNMVKRRKRWYSPLIYYRDVKLYKMTGCASR
jgi:hypothetical protein